MVTPGAKGVDAPCSRDSASKCYITKALVRFPVWELGGFAFSWLNGLSPWTSISLPVNFKGARPKTCWDLFPAH